MPSGMHKGPRNTRDKNSQWASKDKVRGPSKLERRQKSFESTGGKSADGFVMHRPGSNKR